MPPGATGALQAALGRHGACCSEGGMALPEQQGSVFLQKHISAASVSSQSRGCALFLAFLFSNEARIKPFKCLRCQRLMSRTTSSFCLTSVSAVQMLVAAVIACWRPLGEVGLRVCLY